MSEAIKDIRMRNLTRRLRTAQAVSVAAGGGLSGAMSTGGADGIEARRNLAARAGTWRGLADGLVDLITREAQT
jgi:hypothetical protein